MFAFLGPDAKRSSLLKAAPDGELKSFLSQPLPVKNSTIESLDLLAVDFETTGLDPAKDTILSIGFVQIKNLQIDLSTATHYLIKSSYSMPENTVVIHKITDDQLRQGIKFEQAIASLLKALRGKILVAHHAKIEGLFLNQACKNLYGCEIIIPVIDTLAIEAGRLPQYQHHGNLNLNMCSKRYNLPRYKLHDALSDALSCAELLLAQLSYKGFGSNSQLRELIEYKP